MGVRGGPVGVGSESIEVGAATRGGGGEGGRVLGDGTAVVLVDAQGVGQGQRRRHWRGGLMRSHGWMPGELDGAECENEQTCKDSGPDIRTLVPSRAPLPQSQTINGTYRISTIDEPMESPHPPGRASAWLLLLFFLAVASSSSVCLTEDEVQCVYLDQFEDTTVDDDRHLPTCGNDQLQQRPILRDGIVLGRLRFPGTASSHQYDQFRRYESDDMPRFTGIAASAQCYNNNLCLSGGPEADYSLALQQIHLTGFGSHVSYDSVASTLQNVADQRQQLLQGTTSDQPGDFFVITTLRELGSYAYKWYAFRRTWDAVKPELADATFEEWIDEAPWRHNVLTRMLGAEEDRLAMPKNLLYTKVGFESLGAANMGHGGQNSDTLEVFLRDEYMQRQNELGPDESEIYAKAVERLRNMVHFGLFHRLSDSWRLMEHTFCWKMGYQNYRPDKEIIGYSALKAKLFPGVAGDSIDSEAELTRIWNKLKERNRLDLALMEEAERIFDERMDQMKRDREDGILCNFLRKVEVMCEDTGEDAAA